MSPDMEALSSLSVRDKVPTVTKAAELIEYILEIKEDMLWSKIADSRNTKKQFL